MSRVPSCTQYQTNVCAPNITVSPHLATVFDVAPTSGIYSDGQCPSGQTMYIAREPTNHKPNQVRPFFYTCAASLDEAKTIMQNQQPNQTLPLSQSNSECLAYHRNAMHSSCTYSAPDANSIDVKVLHL